MAVTSRFGTTEASQRTYVLADNKLALTLPGTPTNSASSLPICRAFDLDLGMTGFSDDEVVGGVSSDGCASSDPTDAPIHL